MMTKQGKWISNGRKPLVFTAILFILVALYPAIGLSEGAGLPGAAREAE